jgi:hypothetical protein
MTPEQDEAHWRNGFIAMNLLRIGATIVVLLGILLWQTDTLGFQSVIGFPIAIIALVVSFFGPKWLAGRWRAPPSP